MVVRKKILEYRWIDTISQKKKKNTDDLYYRSNFKNLQLMDQ